MRSKRHRQLLVLTGDHAWCCDQAKQLTAACEPLWFAANKAPSSTARRYLGQDLETVIIDAYAGFDPDVFGILAGTIRGGGTLLLLTPPPANWPSYLDPINKRLCVHPWQADQLSGRYLTRLAGLIQHNKDAIVWAQHRPCPAFQALKPLPDTVISIAAIQPNADQQAAITAIERVLHGHRNRPLLLQADRGRGKSAALGMAAKHLLQHADITILITAPRRSAVDTVFKHAQLAKTDTLRLRFIAPDELVLTQPAADLIFVDEAAGIHLKLLEALLRRYRRLVFSSTVHGYEGAGRGFALRFRQLLERYAPNWHQLQLHQPVRWDEGDPLERFCLKALILDAEPPKISTLPRHNQIEHLNRDVLAQNETLLRAVFGLLVQAHYQTRPLDLRQLLDGPNLEVYALSTTAGPIAVALLADEGDLDTPLAQAVASGKRRPQGHQLAQILSYQYSCLEAARLRYTRIVRIAVHPQWQGQGLGSQLLTGITALAQQAGKDMIGAVFGASPDLLAFWGQHDLQALQMGLKRNAASGMYSVLMTRALTPAAKALQTRLSANFQHHLPYLLADPLRELDPDCVAWLLRLANQPQAPLSDSAKTALASFANAERACELVLDRLCEFAQTTLQQPAQVDKLSATQQQALIAKFLQKRSWAECAHLLGLSGRREIEAKLRETVRVLLR